MRYLFYTILSLLLMLAGWTASPPVLTLYQVPFVEHAPVLDGKLDDACWQSVPQNTTLYKYNVMEPIPTPLKTTIQCCYDDKGLYLALRMFEKDMSKIRATITQRDDQSLWTDDCAEIYFDPNAMAIGFRKFMVNSIGTKSTLYRIDGANIDFSWSPDGWLAVPGKDANGWYMELFFPWSDLGRTPKDGDLWRFCLCRYSWSSSALATTSVGGSFTAPQYFGWLLFTRHPTADVNALAQQLGQRVPSDWLLPVQANVIRKLDPKVDITTMSAILTEQRQKVQGQLDEYRVLVSTDTEGVKNSNSLQVQLTAVTIDTTDAVIFQQSVRALGAISQQIENTSYTLQVKKLIREMTQ